METLKVKKSSIVKTSTQSTPVLEPKASKKWTSIIKTQAVDFCLATGLHGYKYIVQRNRTKTERIIWSAIVVSSLCCSLVFMHIAWEYNSAHATLTVIESTHHGIWNYPFPAVTICNNNQVSRSKAHNFVNNLEKLGGLPEEFVLEQMRLLVEMLDPGVFETEVQSNLTVLQEIFDANNYSVSQVLRMVKQDCSTLLKTCKWKGNSTPCYEIFEESLSRDGFCCSFNYFNSKNKINDTIEPKRLTACGYQTGLTILVDPEPGDYFASLYGSYGVKVILHYPYNFPDRSSEFKLVGLGVQAFLGVSPEETYSTPGVKELPIKVRNCIFNKEKLPQELSDLKKNYTWTRYSYVNCLSECRAYTALKKCGCVPYYITQNGTRVCNLRDVKCLAEIRSTYDTSWPGITINSIDLPDVDIDLEKRPCGCLLDCTVYQYPVDSTQGILDKDKFYSDENFFSKADEAANFSLVNVFFTDLVSIQYRRDIYYSWKNLFASFGGLLGLFVGFSLMTGFELVYFFIVRVIADKCIRRKNNINIRSFN